MMRRPPADLDTLLDAWKREVLPEAFPDLAAFAPAFPPLGPAYWRVMRSVWSGEAWRPYLAATPAWRAPAGG